MNSVLLCEGESDLTLLQVFMCETGGWTDIPDRGVQNSALCIADDTGKKQRSRILKKNNDKLTIMSTGGCSRIPKALELVLKMTRNAAPPPPFEQAYKKIAIVTDNDEPGTTADTIDMIKNKLAAENIIVSEPFQDKKWISCKMTNSVGMTYEFEVLLLVIPFTHQGAIETFLLDAISANDPYDADIINKCKNFVATADPDPRYLKKRGDITKAEFATYFCIRTPSKAFIERRNVMKTGIRWSDYTLIQEDFSLLAHL